MKHLKLNTADRFLLSICLDMPKQNGWSARDMRFLANICDVLELDGFLSSKDTKLDEVFQEKNLEDEKEYQLDDSWYEWLCRMWEEDSRWKGNLAIGKGKTFLSFWIQTDKKLYSG